MRDQWITDPTWPYCGSTVCYGGFQHNVGRSTTSLRTIRLRSLADKRHISQLRTESEQKNLCRKSQGWLNRKNLYDDEGDNDDEGSLEHSLHVSPLTIHRVEASYCTNCLTSNGNVQVVTSTIESLSWKSWIESSCAETYNPRPFHNHCQSSWPNKIVVGVGR